MFQYLELIKQKLESDFNTYLTTLEVQPNSVLYRYIDLDVNTKSFNTILEYSNESFEYLDDGTYENTLDIDVIFVVRKTKSAIEKINELRNAFIRFIRENNTLGNQVELVSLVRAEIDEEIETIDSRDSKAIKFTIQILDTL